MPSVEQFTPYEIPGKPWGTELVIGQCNIGGYLGKVLTYNAGHQGAMQLHRVKDETFYLVSGRAEVSYTDAAGHLIVVPMKAGMAFHVPPGSPHKFTAIEECVVFEVGNVVFNDRVNVAEQYGDEDGRAR